MSGRGERPMEKDHRASEKRRKEEERDHTRQERPLALAQRGQGANALTCELLTRTQRALTSSSLTSLSRCVCVCVCVCGYNMWLY